MNSFPGNDRPKPGEVEWAAGKRQTSTKLSTTKVEDAQLQCDWGSGDLMMVHKSLKILKGLAGLAENHR